MLGFDPSYFQNMEGGQKPSYLYIGCSDSRAPAASLMGLQPGDMFVHRNIANIHGQLVVASLDYHLFSHRERAPGGENEIAGELEALQFV